RSPALYLIPSLRYSFVHSLAAHIRSQQVHPQFRSRTTSPTPAGATASPPPATPQTGGLGSEGMDGH
ncbi:MAG TPA: hypothetical protein VM537_35700, partial [Anaerolineae bacterium]|nr:hypothetical protein [Anaerolineae bacterium]